MSSQSYSRDMAKLSLAKMLQTIGWNSINTTPLEILTDILVQYLLQISRTAHDYANEFGCTDPNLDHIGLAFRDCHVNLAELEEYVTFVDFAQPPIPVPKYPIPKEDNLNFLKPGSKECLTRPVHIHEHLPSISFTEAENETDAALTEPVKPEEMPPESTVKNMDGDNVLFKRPSEVSPSDSFKRIKVAASTDSGTEAEQGRPTREISSVMMTTSGFISPAREGRLPDSRTPIVLAPISDPPSPEPPTESPPLPTPAQPVTVTPVPQSPQPGIPIIADSGDATTQAIVDVVKQELQEYNDKGSVQQEQVQVQVPAVQQDRTPAIVGMMTIAGGGTTPIMKKIKGPRKLEHHIKSRKEKVALYQGPSQPHQNLAPLPSVARTPPGIKSKTTGNQSSKDLVRQMKKHHQQVMDVQALVHSQIADMDQPMNLSTAALPKSPHQNVDVTIHHAKVAKAKTNRTLAAARRKTEKLNTTITPVPMPAATKTSDLGVDKLFNEPDKRKVNIIKKISSVRNDGKPAALGKPAQIEEDGHMHPLLPNDVTIELVDIRNNQTQQGASGSGLDDLLANPVPLKEKRKRKDRVAKPRKVPKLMPMSSPSPWDDLGVIERPKSPDLPHSHSFPKMPSLGSGLPFPFLPQFSGPGLIPAFPNPLFPNHLLPHHAYAARAAALSSIIHHHNPYLADPQSNNDDNQPSTSSQAYSMGSSVPGRPGRPRKTPVSSISRHQASSTVSSISDSAASSQLKQGFVSSTTMSPQRSYTASPADQSHNNAQPKHLPASQQVSSSSTSASASASRSTPPSSRARSSSPNHGVVGSTVMLTPPLMDPAVVMPSAIASTSCAPAMFTSTVPSASAKVHSPPASGSTKKHREHKKDKKDKVKKKSKKDRSKKDKVEKKKLREQLKIKLKKEKKERKKEKDMGRSNLSETLTIPKLTLKLGSPPQKSGQHDQSGTDPAKLMVKPIILRKEENNAADDVEKKRESSPELARISPLVTGQPKPKFVQSVTTMSSNQQNNEFSMGTKKFPVFKPIPRLAEIVTEEATSSAILPRTNIGSIDSVTSSAPIPPQIPIPSKYICFETEHIRGTSVRGQTACIALYNTLEDHHNHHHHQQHAQHYTLDNDSLSTVSTVRCDSSPASTSAMAVKAHHVGPGRPRKQTVTSGKHVVPVQQQQQVGRAKVSRQQQQQQQQQITATKLFNKPHKIQADSLGNEVWICPHCGKQDDGSPMIGCDDCDAWYHWVCVNMQVPPEENEDWYCKNCIKKRMQSSLLPEKKKKRKKKDRKEH